MSIEWSSRGWLAPGVHLASVDLLIRGARTMGPLLRGAAGEGSSHPKLNPLNVASLNHIPNTAFSAAQAGASSLDLQKHDALYPTLGQTIKDHEVYGAAEKANILRIVGECRKVRDQLLMDFAGRNGLASLDRILANDPGVPSFPHEDVHPGRQKAHRYSDDEPEQVRWQGGLAEMGKPIGDLKCMAFWLGRPATHG